MAEGEDPETRLERRATIQDVARRAGVSIATVSRVLNGSGRVGAALADRVRAASLDLKYQPNRAARALAGGRSAIIGLLVTDIQNPFFMEIIRGVEHVAQRHGYLVVLCNSAEDPSRERKYVEVLCAEPVAGAIVVPVTARQPTMQPFREHGIPLVALDRRVRDRHADAVVIDNVGAAREAVAHLVANGYRRIGVSAGPESTPTAWERREGYRQALREAGLPLDPALERGGPLTEDGGRRMADELLDLDPPIDALFTGNNRLTMGALEAIQARGLRVPTDLALACFDEVPWVTPGFPSLTTVTQPAYELGEAACARLMQRLEQPGQLTRRDIVLAHRLRVGASSQPRTLAADGSVPSDRSSLLVGADHHLLTTDPLATLPSRIHPAPDVGRAGE